MNGRPDTAAEKAGYALGVGCAMLVLILATAVVMGVGLLLLAGVVELLARAIEGL